MNKYIKKITGLAFASVIAISAVSVASIPVNAAERNSCKHPYTALHEEDVNYSGATRDYHIVTSTHLYICTDCGVIVSNLGRISYYESHDYEIDYSTGENYCTICGDRY